MSAIPSSLTVDASHSRRSLSAKPPGAGATDAGNAGKFSDFLTIGSSSTDPGTVSLVTGDEDGKADGDKAAADPGNPLPSALPVALPIFADLPPPVDHAARPVLTDTATPVIARSVASPMAIAIPTDSTVLSGESALTGATVPAAPTGATGPMILPQQMAAKLGDQPVAAPQDVAIPATGRNVPVAGNVPAAETGAPLVTPSDTAMLAALTRATGQTADTSAPAPQTSGFRLVVAAPQTDATIATPALTPALPPALPSGPLTVRQPAQGTTPVIGLLADTLRTLSASSEDRDEATERPTLTVTGGADPVALATIDGTRPVVAATATADQAPLDMTQHHWPQAMIDRIDRMREDAATADTRIQLSPDALGGIAVAIRREDDRTHLHFTAEQAHTATILADAHETLSRLAEDKGMRLGSMAVNAGASDGSDLGQSARDQRPAAPPAPIVPARPRAPDADPFREGAPGLPDAATASTRIA